jgi:WD40 repeat protein
MPLGFGSDSLASSVADDTSAALETYREFLTAWESAEDMEALYPFLREELVSQFESLPEERQAMIASQVLNPRNADRLKTPAGGFSLVSSRRDGDELDLFLGASRTEGDVRIDLRQKATLVEVGDGWKVDDPAPSPWRVTARMPVDMTTDAGSSTGPGAGAWDTGFSGSFGDLELVAEVKIEELSSTVDDFIRWDPTGSFVAVGEGDGATYLSLPDLEPVWVSGARNSGFLNMSVSHDGRWQLVSGSGGAAMLPLAESLERTPPADDYFFVEPDFAAISREAGRVRIADMAFHPDEPVVAIVNREGDGHSIYFQAPESLVSGDDQELSPDALAVEVQPTSLAWSADGAYLAFIRGYSEPGADVEVVRFPDGETVARLSAEGFSPGRIRFSADENRVLVIGGTNEGYATGVWDVDTAEAYPGVPAARYGAWAPDSRHLFLVQSGGVSSEEGVDNVILLVEPGKAEPVATLDAFPTGDGKFPSRIHAVSVSPNGRYLAATAVTYSAEGDKSLTVKLWQIAGEP